MRRVSVLLVFCLIISLTFIYITSNMDEPYKAISITSSVRVVSLELEEEAGFKLKVDKDYVDSNILYNNNSSKTISFDQPGVYMGKLVYEGFSKDIVFKVGNSNILSDKVYSNYGELRMYFKDEEGRTKISDEGGGRYNIPLKDGELYLYKKSYTALKIADIKDGVITGTVNFVDFRENGLMMLNIERDLIE